jgi:hypothetical protein
VWLLLTLGGCAAQQSQALRPAAHAPPRRGAELEIDDPAACAPFDVNLLEAPSPNLLDASRPPKFRDLTLEEAIRITPRVQVRRSGGLPAIRTARADDRDRPRTTV